MKILKRTEWLYHWECDGKIYEIRTDEKAAAIAKDKGWRIDLEKLERRNEDAKA